MASKKDCRESDAVRKKRLARMRRYYLENKGRWQKYKATALSKLSDVEKELCRQRNREYSRRHYLVNREKINARTLHYRLSDPTRWAAYQATWYQRNKPTVAARRQRHYHAVVKPCRQAARAAAAYLSIREAVAFLGVNFGVFQRWVYDGRIEAIKTPGGRYRLSRETVERIRDESRHYPKEIRDRLWRGTKGGVK